MSLRLSRPINNDYSREAIAAYQRSCVKWYISNVHMWLDGYQSNVEIHIHVLQGTITYELYEELFFFIQRAARESRLTKIQGLGTNHDTLLQLDSRGNTAKYLSKIVTYALEPRLHQLNVLDVVWIGNE